MSKTAKKDFRVMSKNAKKDFRILKSVL